MRIVAATQAFKGSLSALDAAKAVEGGVRRVLPDAEVVAVPVADGGDGTLETLVDALGGEVRAKSVTGPLGEPVVAEWGALADGTTAVVEMARSSGIALVPAEKRNPLLATTYGLGELIRRALEQDFRSFIVGIGGSATNDAGAGMAQALGARLLDSDGRELPRGGAALAMLHSIDLSALDRRATESRFLVACDVSNPLTGPEGASAIYGPQKGATEEMVAQLDLALGRFAEVVSGDLGIDAGDRPGAGAAGGLGAGLVAFLEAELSPGVDIVLDAVGLDGHLEGADLVITGEGSLDYQTVYNKAPIGVARRAKARGIPVVAVAGSLGERFELVHERGIDAAVAITSGPMSLEEASTRAFELVAQATEEALRLMRLGGDVFC